MREGRGREGKGEERQVGKRRAERRGEENEGRRNEGRGRGRRGKQWRERDRDKLKSSHRDIQTNTQRREVKDSRKLLSHPEEAVDIHSECTTSFVYEQVWESGATSPLHPPQKGFMVV